MAPAGVEKEKTPAWGSSPQASGAGLGVTPAHTEAQLSSLLLAYAACLKELRRDLGSFGVEGPIRRAAETLTGFRNVIGLEDARELAKDGLVSDLHKVVSMDLWSAKRRGVPYAAIFHGIARILVDAMAEEARRLPPASFRRFVDRLARTAHEYYLIADEVPARDVIEKACEKAYAQYLEDAERERRELEEFALEAYRKYLEHMRKVREEIEESVHRLARGE
uniref:Uncharacterized protein n=1 Tax=Thermofilum pendens TaxID=2269 RepID=A0A7J3X5E4_THEPE